jgi:hypothetical protein
MNTRLHSTLAALLLGTVCLPSAFAAYQGVKGSITLTLSATSEIGGFLVKDADLAAAAEKGITYEEDSIQNPPGFNAESSKANYYSEKTTAKARDYDPSVEGEDFHPTSFTYEESTKLHTQRMANADFIKNLVARGYVPESALSDHRLVVIFPADRPTSDATPPALFFIENISGSSIHYVGRETTSFGTDGETAYSPTTSDALLLDFGTGVEAYTFKSVTTFTHQRVPDGEGGTTWEFDEEGQETVSDVYSGKVRAYIDLFPEVSSGDSESFTSTGSSYFFSGLLSFSGRLDTRGDQDATNDLYVTTHASLLSTASSGSFYGDYDSELGYYLSYGVTTGSFNIINGRAVADITPYLNAIPENLSWLKQAIINSYAPSSD